MGLNVDIKKTLPGFTLETAFHCDNSTLGLLGGSGSGKSMTLKCIAGLLRPDEGRIELDGCVLFDSASGIDLPPQRRRTGYLFQNYALFPNMTVERNIRCGLPRRRDRGQVRALMERLRLLDLADRYPHELSGGQQQRTALARILASQPRVLMLDEPFSALDAFLREKMQLTVAELIRTYGGITILVSHDRDEIYRLSGRIGIYDNGRLVRIGERQAVFDRPGTRAAAVLTGCRNVVAAHACGPDAVQVDGWGVKLRTAEPVDDTVTAAGVRAHYFCPVERTGDNTIACRLESVIESPFETTVYLRPVDGSEPLCWKADKQVLSQHCGRKMLLLHVPQQAVLPLR